MSYQPASWNGGDNQMRNDYSSWNDNDGQANYSNQGYNNQGYNNQGYGNQGYGGNQDSVQTTMRDQYGRQYRCVCVPIDRPRPRPRPRPDINQIVRMITGRNINDARRIYPNIRVVIRDGQHLTVTQDFRSDRVNVETRNNIITRVVGLY